MCFYRGRHEEFKDFLSQEVGVVFCNVVCSVMEVHGHEFNPDQWRLFIDSSKVSLKLVLLHNGHRYLSVPLAHAPNVKESYESMKLLLGKVKYDEFNLLTPNDDYSGRTAPLTSKCCILYIYSTNVCTE